MVVVRFSVFFVKKKTIWFWRVRMQCQHGKHERLRGSCQDAFERLKMLAKDFNGCGF